MAREATQDDTADSSGPDGGHILDVVVIGAGIAGLVAARRLSGRSVVVLEAADLPGGRIASEQDGVTLNLGAHMVPQPGSVVGDLVAELGLPTRPLPPRLIGMLHDGRRHLGVPPTLLPFALNLSASERLAFIRMGLRLRLGAARSIRAGRPRPGEPPRATRSRVLQFEDQRTLAELVGPLPDGVARLFGALTERNGADPDAMSAGHGLRSFANVWARTAPGLALVGGAGVLPATLGRELGSSLRTGHAVHEVRRLDNGLVRVSHASGRGEAALHARACVLATPAPVTLRLAPDLPQATRTALAAVRYGPFLSVAVELRPPARPPCPRTYAISTPGLAFSVLFNHAAMQADPDAGTALMLFRGASGAAGEMALNDDALAARWLDDLQRAFPETRGHIGTVRVGRWPLGAPYAFPGRTRLQPMLDGCPPPFWLAGDYLDFPNMEAAAESGAAAADSVAAWLDRAPRPTRAPAAPVPN